MEVGLRLRALNEGQLVQTMNGSPLPQEALKRVTDDVTRAVVQGTFSAYRYDSAVGLEQLRGLSEEQRSCWRRCLEVSHGRIRTHEDSEQELGFFWAART